MRDTFALSVTLHAHIHPVTMPVSHPPSIHVIPAVTFDIDIVNDGNIHDDEDNPGVSGLEITLHTDETAGLHGLQQGIVRELNRNSVNDLNISVEANSRAIVRRGGAAGGRNHAAEASGNRIEECTRVSWCRNTTHMV